MDTPHIQSGHSGTQAQQDTLSRTRVVDVAVEETAAYEEPLVAQNFGGKWLRALKSVLAVYLAVHIAFFITTCLAGLFVISDFSSQSVPIQRLWESWHHWDTGHYMWIAVHGYDVAWRTAFFPLYPLLERAALYVTHNALLAGLLISNVAGLVMLMVLHQLVREDFDSEIAGRTVLYLTVFPTAFFFAAAYNESLFMCLVLLSFYHMRHGRWWLAGIFGFFASLTRSAGILLLLPFCYEYLRQREFRLRDIGFEVVSGGLIAAGIGVFALYCYAQFHDYLAFSHAQSHWQHVMHGPWHGIVGAVKAIVTSNGPLTFQALRNLLDLIPDLLMLVAIVLGLLGPWRFSPSQRSYVIYAATLYLFLQLFPVAGTGLFPLQSIGRYMLEVFPAFIVLARIGKSQSVHLHYVMISTALLFFLLTQFLTGHWVL